MPAKNSIKIYIENGLYHAYNRGVEKRDIFLEETDFAVFLHFLKYYLSPPSEKDIKQKNKTLVNEVKLLAYCLMPNHYHLLVKQSTLKGMTKLIRAVCTSYAGYFNNKYDRVGTLFQGKYKAVLISDDNLLLHVSRYIHLNPTELKRVGPFSGSDPIDQYPYSSYNNYLGNKKAQWLDTQLILNYFNSPKNLLKISNEYQSYQKFVEEYREDPRSILGELTVEGSDP